MNAGYQPSPVPMLPATVVNVKKAIEGCYRRKDPCSTLQWLKKNSTSNSIIFGQSKGCSKGMEPQIQQGQSTGSHIFHYA
jgi:hypothetical protein